MAKLTTLDQFFPIQIGVLREGTEIPFALFVYLPLNKRIIQFRHKQDLIDAGFGEVYTGKGLQQFFVPNLDQKAYIAYLEQFQEKRNEEAAAAAAEEIEKKQKAFEEQAAAGKKPVDEDGVEIEAAFDKDPDAPELPPEVELDEEQKEAVQETVKELMTAAPAEQAKAMEKMADIAKEVVLEGEKKQSLFTDLWQESAQENFDGHAKNIASFSVVFAMGMGFKNRDTLKNLSLAGLIHDVGISQIDLETARATETERTKEQKTAYEDHLRYTLEMLSGMSITLNPELLKMLGGHHEKFDGTGYPKHIKNWDVDSLAQVLSMADIFDGMIRGRHDGKERTLTEAFQDIVKVEKSKIFPQYYNPDLFNKLVRWVEGQSDTKILQEADQVVAETMDHQLKENKAA